MEEKYSKPNLVSTRLRRAFISGLLPDSIISELNDFGVITHKLGKSHNMTGELAYHPDLLLNNIREGMWLCEHNAKYLPEDIDYSLFRETETELGDLYPFDCPFNNFRINNVLFCGKSADYVIQAYATYEEYRIVFVPQNYTKCCCAIVNEQAIITSDYYIGKALKTNGFDVLIIKDSDTIGLKGFSHGLIGGCSVKLAGNLLGFTGDLNKYQYGNDIRDFCANHNVDAISLSSEPLYDYGGILPISEIIIEDICNRFI
jgi:hypothetical protein